MTLWHLIAGDVRAKARWLYGCEDRAHIVKALLTDGTFAMVVYRLMQAAKNNRLWLTAMWMNKLNIWFGGCVIGRGAQFGPEFVLIHSQGVVINTAVRGGRGIKLEHQVTIGAEKGASPQLGDNVFVGAGARIVGGIKVGNNVKIGANSVVVSDVPDGATAVGNPAKVI